MHGVYKGMRTAMTSATGRLISASVTARMKSEMDYSRVVRVHESVG